MYKERFNTESKSTKTTTPKKTTSNSTKKSSSSSSDIFDRLNDPSTYTGIYKERFKDHETSGTTPDLPTSEEKK